MPQPPPSHVYIWHALTHSQACTQRNFYTATHTALTCKVVLVPALVSTCRRMHMQEMARGGSSWQSSSLPTHTYRSIYGTPLHPPLPSHIPASRSAHPDAGAPYKCMGCTPLMTALVPYIYVFAPIRKTELILRVHNLHCHQNLGSLTIPLRTEWASPPNNLGKAYIKNWPEVQLHTRKPDLSPRAMWGIPAKWAAAHRLNIALIQP